MTIAETIDQFLADLDRDSVNRAKYSWRKAYDSALLETEPSKRLERIAFAETLLYSRRRQLRAFIDDLDASEELEALQAAIEHLRSLW
jgi:hypothetical protein